ncbi:MAG: hypothetical protein ACR2Q3_19680 [Woeseiaceae bacterium]
MPTLVARCSALAVMLPVIAASQDSDNIWMASDRASARVGAFTANFDTDVRLASDLTGEGTLVSIEDDFGLDDSTTNAFIHGHYRFNSKHRLDLAWYDLSRDGVDDVRRDIEFGDINIGVGAVVDTNFDYQIAKLVYSYSLAQNEKLDLALAVGVYTAIYDIRATNVDTGDEEQEDGVAPVPLVGIRAGYFITPRWLARAQLEYLEISIGDGEATYLDSTVSIEYHAFERIGFGLAYNFVDVEGEDKGSNDQADFAYDGLVAFVSWRFD